jgi:hypothetical protein
MEKPSKYDRPAGTLGDTPTVPETPIRSPIPSKAVEAPQDAFTDFVPNQAPVPTFTAEDAKDRQGNYVLSFGLAGSGKSTFHSSLLRHLEQGGEFTSKVKPVFRDGKPDAQTRHLLNSWRETWKTGRFVRSTPNLESAIREISYNVTPNKGVKTPLDFNLIEVSGELLRRVEGRGNSSAMLPDAIHYLFDNPRINLLLIVLIHPDTPSNDLLLVNLLDLIEEHFPHRRATMSLGIVIANPEKSLEQLKRVTGGEDSQFAHESKLEGELVFDYLQQMAPGIFTVYKTWPAKKRMITPLSLGAIGHRQSEGDETEPYLKYHDPTDIGKIFKWMYKQFIGKDLGPTWFGRLLISLKGEA